MNTPICGCVTVWMMKEDVEDEDERRVKSKYIMRSNRRFNMSRHSLCIFITISVNGEEKKEDDDERKEEDEIIRG